MQRESVQCNENGTVGTPLFAKCANQLNTCKTFWHYLHVTDDVDFFLTILH